MCNSGCTDGLNRQRRRRRRSCFRARYLRFIPDLEISRNQRNGFEFFSRERDLMRWFPIAFLANAVLKVTLGGIELTILCHESACSTTASRHQLGISARRHSSTRVVRIR